MHTFKRELKQSRTLGIINTITTLIFHYKNQTRIVFTWLSNKTNQQIQMQLQWSLFVHSTSVWE